MAVAEVIDANKEIEAEPRVADYVVADVHVTPPGMWRDYLPPQFRVPAPTLETDGASDGVVVDCNRRKVHLIQLHKTTAQNFKAVPTAERDWIIAGCAEKFFGLR